MSFEMMCFVMVIVMGVAIAIYGAIKVNGGVQPKMVAKQVSNRKEDVKEKWEFWINIFWTNTAMGWMWRELFGKKKAKQAPPHFSTGNSNTLYITPPPPPARRSSLHIPTPPPISSYNTSSLNMGNKIGKPLVIQNWDRLIGMVFPTVISNNQYGNWIVTQAGESRDGYSCLIENGGGFGTSNKAVSLNVYSDMYDSHRVLVKCGGRISTMDIETFKDPNNMLYKIANEFQEKFR